MHHAVREDRLWFQNNPKAIVRFRSAAPGEFVHLEAIGEEPPVFRPSVCRATAPLRWVAVVDLIRLAGSTDPVQTEPTIRLRLRVPALHSTQRLQKAEEELLDAIAAELFESLECEQAAVAA